MILPDHQLECNHAIGATCVEGKLYFLRQMTGCSKVVYEAHKAEMFADKGGGEFTYCPDCGRLLKDNTETIR